MCVLLFFSGERERERALTNGDAYPAIGAGSEEGGTLDEFYQRLSCLPPPQLQDTSNVEIMCCVPKI